MTFNLLDLVLHVDRYLAVFFQDFGWVAYALIFLVIFIETGVVVFPFLPGDSLLFACGAFAAAQGQPLGVFLAVIAGAAILGNTVNYLVGRFFGHVLLKPKPDHKPLIKPEHLEETHRFFARWGGWAVTLSRFFPFIRTFTPFIAGVADMKFGPFTWFNLLGGGLWTLVFTCAGFWLGNFPLIKDNFSLIVLAVLVMTAAPALYALWHARPRKKT